MAENTNTEREAFEKRYPLWAGVYWDGRTYVVHDSYVNSYRADRYVGAWEAWQARASLSLPAAGQEPVATVFTMEALTPGAGLKYHATIHKPLPAGTKLYAAPQPAVAAGWVKLPGQLPEPGKPVLLDIGKKFPIRAMWAAKHTVEAADDDTDWAEYDETTETYYAPEGWYEWNQHEETNWAVTETPRAWCELPQTLPPAPSTEGESNG